MAILLRCVLCCLCAVVLAAQSPPSTSPSEQPTPITVAQLRALLASPQEDAILAAHLNKLQLTQRLGFTDLDRLRDALPGPGSRDALTVLADRSIFLAAPPASVPPAPDLSEQRRIMARTVDYVAAAMHKLPDFFATRTTLQFADWPGKLQIGDKVSARDLPLAAQGTFTDTITYRKGAEIVSKRPARPSRHRKEQSTGLQAWGVFGPILSIVLVDAAHGTAAWDRWELIGSSQPALVAVFRYTVAMKKSTYSIKYCCMYGAGDYNTPIDRHTAYHGEIAVDPATGAILRITVIADLGQGDTSQVLDEALHGEPLRQADLAVEYGPVSIGGITYICPTHSIALSRVRTQISMGAYPDRIYFAGPIRTYLNDVTFTDYHLFRSEMRILPADPAQNP